MQRQHLLGGRLCRHHGDAATVVGEQPQDVALDAEVVGDDVQALAADAPSGRLEAPVRAFVPLIDALGRDDLGEVHALQAGKLARRMHGRRRVDFLAGHDAAGQGALLAQDAGQPAGVDVGDRDDLAALQETLQGLRGAPVRVSRGRSRMMSPAA